MKQPLFGQDLEQKGNRVTAAPTETESFRPVVLKRPVAATNHPSWMEDGETAALSTDEPLAQVGVCQHRADLKPFKGRGADRRLRDATADVDKVHDEMRALVELTRGIKARRIYLALHTRASSGQASLRWRRAGATSTSHIAWRDLEQWLAPLPHDLANWYRECNRAALALNEREKSARAAARSAEAQARLGPSQVELSLPRAKESVVKEL